jgi:hypothetical protein
VGVFRAGDGSGYASLGSTEVGGTLGTGGQSGGSTQRGGDGRSSTLLESFPSLFNNPSDFDGDGINDFADACPTAAGSGSGCPAREPRLVDSDGDRVPDDADRCPATPAGPKDVNVDGCPDVTPTPTPTPTRTPAPTATATASPAATATATPPAVAPQPRDERPPVAQPAKINVLLSFGFSSSTNRSTKFTRLSLSELPAGSTVKVTCKGGGCPKALKGKGYTKRSVSGTLNLRQFVKKPIRAGTVIKIVVSRAGMISNTKTMTVRKRRGPLVRSS